MRIQIGRNDIQSRYVDQSYIFSSRFNPLKETLQLPHKGRSVVDPPGRRNGDEIHDVHVAKRTVIGAQHELLHSHGGLCKSQQRGQETARRRSPVLCYVSQVISLFKFDKRLEKDEASCASSAKDETRR